jgi:CHAT domain-containing protein/Tfp pilus assembly protein PilF
MKAFLFFSLLTLIVNRPAVLAQQAAFMADTLQANSWYSAALKHKIANNYDSSTVLFTKAAVLYRKHQQWAQKLDCDNGLAFNLLYSDPQSAITLAERTMSESINRLGKDNAREAAAIVNIALGYYYMSEYKQALALSQRALKIRLKIYGGPFHPDVAISYTLLGQMFTNDGDYESALAYHQQALQIRRKKLPEFNVYTADSYEHIGNVYNYLSENESALAYHQQALRIRLKVEHHSDVANSYTNIGNIYDNLGEYDKALENYQQALQIWLKTERTERQVATCYNNIGTTYFNNGEYEGAIEYFQQALQIRQKVLEPKNPDIADTYVNLANVYSVNGTYDEAIKYHQQALQIYLKAYQPDNPSIAAVYNNLGIIYTHKGEYDQAIEYHQRALQIRLIVYKNKVNHPAIASVYTNLGNAYTNKGEYSKAIQYLQQALQVFIIALGENNPDVADAYNNLGEAYKKKGEYNQALKHYQQALVANVSVFTDTLFTSNPVLFDQADTYLNGSTLLTSLMGKAQVLETKFIESQSHQNLQLAYQTLGVADTLIQQIRNSYVNEQDKLTFLDKATLSYRQALSLCLRLHALTRDDSYLDGAFYLAEQGKGSILLASLAESKARSFSNIPDSLLIQDKNLKLQLAYYTQLLTQELSAGEAMDSAKLYKYQDRVFVINRQLIGLINRFEQGYPHYYNLKYRTATASLKDLQKVLDKRTALVSYVLGDTSLYILTLTATSLDVQKVRLDSNFSSQLSAFQDYIYEDKDKNERNLQYQALYQSAAHRLYEQLWPQALPAPIQHVILVPDGALHTIPFEALLTNNKGSGRKMPYLLKRYAISYAYSATLLHEQLTRQDDQPSKQLLAIAPVFADEETTLPRATTRGAPAFHQADSLFMPYAPFLGNRTDTAQVSVRKRSSYNQYISPLLASEQEVKVIARLFRRKGEQAKVLKHQQAKEEQLKEIDLTEYGYLHFATYGVANSDLPELTSLYLTQDSSSSEDGVLYVGEVYNLRLNAQLVTLSACQTGLGKVARGEGMMGLTRAMLYAGARNVAVSLWQVDDQATATCMRMFYQKILAGQGNTYALQQAKLRLLRYKKFAHPNYWAAFVLVGR